MDATTLKLILKKGVQCNDSFLIVSEPGMGKSDIVKQVAAELQCDLATFHPSVEEPTDVKGFPWCTTGPDGHVKAEFVTYGEMARLLNPTRKTIAFYDDLGQADEDMQAALMQVLWARELNGKPISKNVSFIGATNDADHKAAVRGFIEPLKSRFASIVRYAPTTDDWVEWAYQNHQPDILISFIKTKPDQLHKFEATKALKNSPCPRTVANWGKMLVAGYPREALYELCCGCVGETFATEFMAYQKLHGKMPTFEDIMTDPEGIDIPSEISIIYAVVVSLARRVNETNFETAVKFINRLKPEFQVMTMKDIRIANKKISRTASYRDWLTNNADLLGVA